MKKLFFIALFIFITGSVYSQDLIVTNKGDSINCKITKVNDDVIYFTFKYKDEIRNTLLPISGVIVHQFDYFQTSEVPKDRVAVHGNYQRFRFAINGGYSYRTAKMADGVQADFKDYTNKLRSGYHLGADLTYFYNESLGVGLKYNLFKSSNSMDNIYVQDNHGNRRYGKMSDNIKISFIAPSFSIRQFNRYNSKSFFMNVSLGYLGYVNDAVLVDDFRITSGTLGLSLGLGYDIRLSEDISLGFQLSFLQGTLTKYYLSDGINSQEFKLEKGSYESLSRIDLSVGLVFGNN